MIEQYLNFIWFMLVWLFIAFIFVIAVKNRVVGTIWETPCRYLFYYPFAVFDCLSNWVLTPLFLDAPANRYELVTGRMVRYERTTLYELRISFINCWRYHFATKLCWLLSKVDKGHCNG